MREFQNQLFQSQELIKNIVPTKIYIVGRKVRLQSREEIDIQSNRLEAKD